MPRLERARRGGNYEVFPLKVADTGVIEPGSINRVEIGHDDWCGFSVHAGRCDCQPEITVTTPEGRFEVQQDGTLQVLDAN